MQKTIDIAGKNAMLVALLALAAGPALSADVTSNVQSSSQGTPESGAPATGTGSSGISGASVQQDTEQSRAADSSGAGQSRSSTSAAGSTGANAKAPVVVLFPLDVITVDSAMNKGCWARIYDRENYNGDSLTVVGPTSIADMTGPFGLNWDDRVNSIQVGPKTTVTVYDNENFRDQVARFKPGQKVSDLSKRLGFFDEFASIRLDCSQG